MTTVVASNSAGTRSDRVNRKPVNAGVLYMDVRVEVVSSSPPISVLVEWPIPSLPMPELHTP
jgi:hypothetical protein